MALFNNIPYKCMRLTNKVNLTKYFSEKYRHMRLITRLYGNEGNPDKLKLVNYNRIIYNNKNF